MEPTDNYDEKKIQEFEDKSKILVCLECQQRFSQHHFLVDHMNNEHQIEVKYTLFLTLFSTIIFLLKTTKLLPGDW